MTIAGWDDIDNTFEWITTGSLTHSTRDGEKGYIVGGDFATSEIAQTISIPDGHRVGARAILTFQRGNIGDNTDDQGNVILEALSAADAVLDDVETGHQSHSPVNIWYPKRLVLDIPEGATKLRIRLVATRDGGSGVLAAAFDDFDLRVHKALDPEYAYELDFREPTVQPTPRNWQRFHLAFPEATTLPDFMMAHGAYAISTPRPISGEGLQWSDVTGTNALPFLGAFGISVEDNDHLESRVYREAFQFVYQGPHLQAFGNGTKRRGQFKASQSFTVRMVLKVRQHGSGAGLIGVRDDATGIGWGMQLTSSGQARATLQGNLGTKTATSVATIADGAPHQVVMVYSVADDTLKVYVDRRGAVSTSTASSMGEFEQPASPAGSWPLLIGTDRSSTDVFGGELLEVELFKDVALSEAEIESMWTYGLVDEDVSVNLSHAVWVPSETTDGIAGVTLTRCAQDQTPIGHRGDSYGLAIGTGSANLWPSNDTSDAAAWVAETTVTATRLIQDNTGLLRGIRIAGDATHGLVVPALAIGASSGTVNTLVYARAVSGTPSLGIELLSSADVVKDSDSFVLSTSWQAVPITALAWDGATATCKLRFRSAGTFELAHVAWAERAGSIGARVPSVVQDAGVTLQNIYAVVDVEHPAQLNHEGEIDIEGIATVASPLASQLGLIAVTGGDEATRTLAVGGSQVPSASHWDSAAASATATGTAIDWSQEWRVRNRWNRTGIPSEAGDTFFGIVVEGSADSNIQDARTGPWSVGSDPLDITWIGHTSANVLDGFVRRFSVRARELKL